MSQKHCELFPIRVRVFVPHPIASAQYSRLLKGERAFHLVSGEEGFQVSVFDGELDCMERGLTMIRLKFPGMRPLLVSFPYSEKESLRWLFRGVYGLVTYDAYEAQLIPAVRQVAKGQLWFPQRVNNHWKKIDTARRIAHVRFFLSPRELEVMEFLLRRFANKDIADILKITERTVKFHVGNILEKLQVTSREQLAAEWVPHFRLA